MSRSVRRACVGFAFAVGVAALGACASDPTKGYSFNSSFDRSVESVAVSIFQNPTFYPGVELELSDAIIKRIQSDTPWRVTSESNARTALTGAITEIHLERLSTDRRTGYVQELDYVITVEFTWKDTRTGKILASKKNFTASDVFTPTQPVGERIESGQHGAVQRLARDLVAELRSNW